MAGIRTPYVKYICPHAYVQYTILSNASKFIKQMSQVELFSFLLLSFSLGLYQTSHASYPEHEHGNAFLVSISCAFEFYLDNAVLRSSRYSSYLYDLCPDSQV